MQGPALRIDTASIVVAAKADDVYRAFSDPLALVAWLPPGNMTGRVLDYHFRQGGRYRLELTYASDMPAELGKTTGRTDISTGRFLALEPGTLVTITAENVPRGIAKADHDAGLRSSLQNLARFLASTSPSPS